MVRFDMTPLYRSTIGFDRLANIFDARNTTDKGASFPPYNVERTGENDYRISMAVAGFSENELELEEQGGTLRIRGIADENAHGDAKNNAENNDDVAERDPACSELRYLYRGIASRNFERRFQLADNVQVSHAALDKGLLHIDLVREVPDAEKPHKIKISKTLSKTLKAA